jgi:hypothetical protein
VIHTIRHSQSADTARKNLIANFKFSEVQAQAILDMQLRRLAALERKKLKDEFDELNRLIARLEDLLAHPEKVLAQIREDLLAIKEKYGDARRTQIVDRTKGALTTTDLLPDQMMWVAVSDSGDLRRQDMQKVTHSTLRQAAKGSEVALLTANTRDLLYLFTRDGRCGRVAVHEIPQDGSAKHLAEMCGFTRRDKVTAALTLPRSNGEPPSGFLLLVTEQGLVKRVTLADVASLTAEATVMNVDDKDRLLWALRTQGDQEVILVTAEGQSIRFREEEVRSMGLSAGGVGGIKLGKGDKLVHAEMVDPDGSLLTISALGFAKQSPLSDYSSQGRNGGGIVSHKLTSKTGKLAAATLIPAKGAPAWLAVLMSKGSVHIVTLAEIGSMGRSVQGKLLVETGLGMTVTGVRWVASLSGGDPTDEPAEKPKERPTGKAAATQPAAPSAARPTQPALRMVDAKPAVKEAVQPANTPSKAKAGSAAVEAKPVMAKDIAKPVSTPSATKASSAAGDAKPVTAKAVGAPVTAKASSATVEVAAGSELKAGKNPASAPATKPVTAKVVTAKATVVESAASKQEAPKPAPAKAVVIQPDENPPAQAGLFGDEVILPKTTKAGKLQAVVSVKKK